ncbi:RipA family octameric membrane protein, partial [Nodularia sp. NIES-3585]|uniref:RipA family octameric membrane protein n=1 Tax=Nodularia sp. NIES-3585 TaxID=1973477 RepID=UPI001C3C88BB
STTNINSYKQLNSLKFKVIHEMETHLPFPCYAREWKVLKEDKHRRRYLRLTSVEQYIPIIFAIPYLCLFVYALIKILKP